MLRSTLSSFILLAAAAAAGAASAQGLDVQQQLKESQEMIRSLQQRVEALERRLASVPAPSTTGPQLAQEQQHRQVPATQQGPVARAPQGSLPDDEESTRALERALVRQGGLVLPPRVVELDPRVQHDYRGTRGLALVQGPAGPLVSEGRTDRHRTEASLGVRIGLPAATQVEIRAPYVWVRQGSSINESSAFTTTRATGFGDAELQITKQLTQEKGAVPALLVSANWKPATGSFDLSGLSTGGGFSTLQAALTAVKRQDPLVFVGGLSYGVSRARTYGGERIKPGDAFGLRLATLLAVSPETSLRTALDLSRSGRVEVGQSRLEGSGRLNGLVELGLSTLISKNAFLDFNVGFGITPDAPDFRFSVAVPIRFN